MTSPTDADHRAFGEELGRFVAAHRRIANVLNIAHYEGDGAREPLADIIRAKGRNVIHSASVLPGLFEESRSELLTEFARHSTSTRTIEEIVRLGELMRARSDLHERGATRLALLGVVAQACIVHIRAYQDSTVWLWRLSRRERIGKETSMAREKDKDDSFARRLQHEYWSWFGWWRTSIRQAAKDGVDFNAQLVDGRLGLVFAGVTRGRRSGSSRTRPCSSPISATLSAGARRPRVRSSTL